MSQCLQSNAVKAWGCSHLTLSISEAQRGMCWRCRTEAKRNRRPSVPSEPGSYRWKRPVLLADLVHFPCNQLSGWVFLTICSPEQLLAWLINPTHEDLIIFFEETLPLIWIHPTENLIHSPQRVKVTPALQNTGAICPGVECLIWITAAFTLH